MIRYSERSTRHCVSGQITSNCRFREIDGAVRIKIKRVIMDAMDIMAVMVIMVMIIMVVMVVVVIMVSAVLSLMT